MSLSLATIAGFGVYAGFLPASLPASQSAGALGVALWRTKALAPVVTPDGRSQAAVEQPSPEPSVTPASTLQLLNSHLVREMGQVVAIGELRNGGERASVNVTLSLAFRDSAGNLIDVGETTIGIVEAGDTRPWRVGVPDRPSIVRSDAHVEWVWR